MPTDPIAELLEKNARYSAAEIASLTGLEEADITSRIAELEASGAILGYHAIIDPELVSAERVTAFIEVKLVPERDGGFDHLALRISKFDQVRSCYLMSGGYDLVVIVDGKSLQDVASFVAQKLSTLEGVTSTATHFHLKTYKQDGFLAHDESEPSRLPVSP
ncbi:MAG: DNA-binding Lrp family transcriptional regulator [Verrucomicrobiales bacterium]|jgi:DNA-binding Lrp family transcriptional regulator